MNYSPNSDLAERSKFDDYYREHLHEGEEIQFVLEGQAYFDFREYFISMKYVKALNTICLL